MPEVPVNNMADIWPKKRTANYIETAVIILLVILSMSLQYGSIDSTIMLRAEFVVRIAGSLCIWFANKYILEYILQSRINANKVTQFLPFELTLASVAVTSIIYIIFYPIILYLIDLSFYWPRFFQGLFVTCGLSLLIVIFYSGVHIWRSWWRDDEFLFHPRQYEYYQKDSQEFITIKNSRGSVNHDLHEIGYFISESKIVFLVDTSGKRWITQYNLSELENILGGRFFRLNRRILVSHQVISEIKKLPNHRLLVTINQPNEGHTETISRYKSTRFKQWLEKVQLSNDHSVNIQ